MFLVVITSADSFSINHRQNRDRRPHGELPRSARPRHPGLGTESKPGAVVVSVGLRADRLALRSALNFARA